MDYNKNMAIEVIEQTPNNPNDKFECTCPVCKCKVSYYRHDITPHRNHPFGYITCPTCKKVISHEESYLVEKGEGKLHEEVMFDPRKYITRAQKAQYEADLKKAKTSMTVLLVLAGICLFTIIFGAIVFALSMAFLSSDTGMGGSGEDVSGTLFVLVMLFYYFCVIGGSLGFTICLGLGLGLNIPKIANRNRHLRKKIWEEELEKRS